MNKNIQNAIIEVLKSAVLRENEAFNYYYRASLKAVFPEIKSLLIQLSEEERKHRLYILRELERIQQLFENHNHHQSIQGNEIQFSIPEKLSFKKIIKVKGLDLSALSLPAEMLGGDYFDIVHFDSQDVRQKLGIFLFDVMGHGLDATHLKARSKRFSVIFVKRGLKENVLSIYINPVL